MQRRERRQHLPAIQRGEPTQFIDGAPQSGGVKFRLIKRRDQFGAVSATDEMHDGSQHLRRARRSAVLSPSAHGPYRSAGRRAGVEVGALMRASR